jgi:uridylate kinase
MERDTKKILIKLSGGALSNGKEKYTESILKETAGQIKEVHDKGFEIALVVGGGNLFRGAELAGNVGIRRSTGDYIGMLATVQNALALRDFFETQGLVVRVSSAIAMPQICEAYMPQRARRHLAKGRIVIFAGGTGMPYFTTDTTASQRALELNCGQLILAKDGVDGVYTADPKTDQSAIKIDTITATEVIEQDLKVADASAIAMCRDNGLPIRVIAMRDINKLEDNSIGTTIVPE